jgi:hypothetical protein
MWARCFARYKQPMQTTSPLNVVIAQDKTPYKYACGKGLEDGVRVFVPQGAIQMSERPQQV